MPGPATLPPGRWAHSADALLRQLVDVHPALGVLARHEVRRRRLQQVSDLLLVNLQVPSRVFWISRPARPFSAHSNLRLSVALHPCHCSRDEQRHT